MRFFDSHWIYVTAVCLTGLGGVVVQGLMAQPPNQSAKGSTGTSAATFTAAAQFAGAEAPPTENAEGESGGGGFFAGMGAGMSDGNHASTYMLLTADGATEQVVASRVIPFHLDQAAAKPKRISSDGGNTRQGGPGSSGMMPGGMGMGGMPVQGGMGMGMSMGMSAMSGMAVQNEKQWPTLYALVLDEDHTSDQGVDQIPRAEVKVVVLATMNYASTGAAMSYTTSGEMSAMEGYGAGMGSGIQPPVAVAEIDTTDESIVRRFTQVLRKASKEERANVAQLIRLDVWIEDARTALREKRNDSNAFATVEAELKSLLTEEYDALLAGQRADVERLRKRLAQLQGDLERRASAKDRVIEVQLGKLVLEAQGLIDAQR